MKRYLSIFAILALFIITIPCLAFVGTSKPPYTGKKTSSAVTFSDAPKTIDADSFKLYNHKTKKVETISVRDYLISVVGAEMPASFHTEALKAQAVASHTYALNMKNQQQKSPNKSLNGADLSTDPATSQSYMTKEELKEFYGEHFDTYYKKISEAVDSVIDKIIVYHNEPIAAAFHSISGGLTEDPANVWGKSLDYLKPVLSDGDFLAPDYESKVTLTSDEVKAKLSAKFPDIQWTTEQKKWIAIKTLTDSKSVKEADVCGTTVSGADLRSVLGLNSAYFTVSFADGKFTFDVKGKGHGVGMSQYGADYLARQGKSYEDILKYYYSDVAIAALEKTSD